MTANIMEIVNWGRFVMMIVFLIFVRSLLMKVVPLAFSCKLIHLGGIPPIAPLFIGQTGGIPPSNRILVNEVWLKLITLHKIKPKIVVA